MVSLFNNSFFKKINTNCYFEIIVAFLYAFIGAIGWLFSYSYSAFGVILLSLILLFIFNDFKYLLPSVLIIIFSYNGGFESTSLPIEIILYSGILIGVIILYTIFNFKLSYLKKPRSYIGILLLSILFILPIFWNNVITENTKVFYLMYFSWLLYLVIYFIVAFNAKNDTFRMLIFVFVSISLLISFECLYSIKDQLFSDNKSGYYLGWGLCNEAGIIICFCLPFIFYSLIKSKNTIICAILVFIMFFSLLGLVATTSRGAMLFGGIEFVILSIIMFFCSKKKLTNIVFYALFVSLGVFGVYLYFGFDNLIELLGKISFDDNGRFDLWKRGIECWNTDIITRIFGSGIVSEIEVRSSFNDWDNVYIVYHSTFFEILVASGIIGVCALLFHFFEKYKQLFKKDFIFLFVFGVGYLIVDFYGMIDNTYGMYYYMIPLTIVIATLDNYDFKLNDLFIK